MDRDDYDREKIIDCMFDPITSLILSLLEDGKKSCSFLAQQSDITENDVLDRFSYLIEHGFVVKEAANDGNFILAANSDKLSSVVENSENFDTAISGLEKMDSYLN